MPAYRRELCTVSCLHQVSPSAPGSAIALYMHQYGILMHMRTTVILNEDLLKKAQELTGLREKTALLHAGLQALISRESAKRLAALGGTEPALKPIPRRRARQGK